MAEMSAVKRCICSGLWHRSASLQFICEGNVENVAENDDSFLWEYYVVIRIHSNCSSTLARRRTTRH